MNFAKLLEAILVLNILWSASSQNDTAIKVDCHPDTNPNQQTCQTRGCIWNPSTVTGEPSCYFDSNNFAGYNVEGQIENTTSGISAVLSRINTPSLFGGDENEIFLKVVYHTESRLEISFNPKSSSKKREKTKWQKFFHETIGSIHKHKVRNSVNSQDLLYDVRIQSSPHFGIQVVRKISGAALFDTTDIPGLTISEQFLSLTTRTPTKNVYGFGEQTHPRLRHDMNWKTWGMFATDGGLSTPGNLYGVHPFYICVENDGRAHGIVLMNPNAQHVQLAPYPSITYRTIGGILSFNIFLGPLPNQVVQQYTNVIGKPNFPPYWALGFHLCRWGYANTSDVEKVWFRNHQAGIPQDAQWIDANYMNNNYDFTYDPVNFATLPNFTGTLHSQNLKLVLITEPVITFDIEYPPLTEGLKNNVFIIDNRTGQPLAGSMRGGNVYWPDFSNPKTVSWWKTQIKNFHSNLSFDGLWLDMNEPTNYALGSLTGCDNNTWNNPPFVRFCAHYEMLLGTLLRMPPTPTGSFGSKCVLLALMDPVIIDGTLCMDSQQHVGIHYNVHNMFGFFESRATKIALDSLYQGQRTFILSRSTFIGSGTYAAHWTGDNYSKWTDMAQSIITSLEFNFFGIPFVGADICGFHLNATEELCTRWYQLGAFYPFSRSHNDQTAIDQDPAAWSPESTASTKKALTTRYKFLPYLNTLMALAHFNGSSVMRPLFFEFSDDSNTYDIDDQFLWGSALMIVPILTTNTTSRTAYFPKGRWFDLNTGTEIGDPGSGRSVMLSIDTYDIGLFIRGGSIIPWQNPSQTATQSHKNPLGILVALDAGQSANGLFCYDNSVYEIYEGFGFDYYYFYAIPEGNQYGLLIIERPSTGYIEFGVYLETIQIYGISDEPTSVDVNGNLITNSSQIFYDSSNKVLALVNLHIQFFEFSRTPIRIKWNYF